MIEKTRKSLALPATHSSLHPADFPVGSAQSRAAARMLAQQRENQRERLEIIITGEAELHGTPWTECSDGTLMRTLCLPGNMSIAGDEVRR